MHKSVSLTMMHLITMLILMATNAAATAQANLQPRTNGAQSLSSFRDFEVIEFRRYQLKEGVRAEFASYFDTYFPEAFQQLGAVAVGQFFERDHPNVFTWVRAFKNMDARATVNAAFYYGPVWKEHAATMNELMVDSDNVLLLKPLAANRGPMVLPAVDAVHEPRRARGVVVAQIFSIRAGSESAFAKQTEEIFARYRAVGAVETGVFVTLDAKNNFPQLPIRTDGPYVVWLGVVENDAILKSKLAPLADRAVKSLTGTRLLRGAPEWLVLDPTPRSRLRWTDMQPQSHREAMWDCERPRRDFCLVAQRM